MLPTTVQFVIIKDEFSPQPTPPASFPPAEFSAIVQLVMSMDELAQHSAPPPKPLSALAVLAEFPLIMHLVRVREDPDQANTPPPPKPISVVFSAMMQFVRVAEDPR